MIDENHIPIASGDFEWENQLVNGIWTYSLDTVHTGIQTCFANLKQDVEAKFGVNLTTVGAIGVSAMMHGYLPFDRDGKPARVGVFPCAMTLWLAARTYP